MVSSLPAAPWCVSWHQEHLILEVSDWKWKSSSVKTFKVTAAHQYLDTQGGYQRLILRSRVEATLQCNNVTCWLLILDKAAILPKLKHVDFQFVAWLGLSRGYAYAVFNGNDGYLLDTLASLVLIWAVVRKMMMMTKNEMLINIMMRMGRWNNKRNLLPWVLMKHDWSPIPALKSDPGGRICWRSRSPTVKKTADPHPTKE